MDISCLGLAGLGPPGRRRRRGPQRPAEVLAYRPLRPLDQPDEPARLLDDGPRGLIPQDRRGERWRAVACSSPLRLSASTIRRPPRRSHNSQSFVTGNGVMTGLIAISYSNKSRIVPSTLGTYDVR